VNWLFAALLQAESVQKLMLQECSSPSSNCIDVMPPWLAGLVPTQLLPSLRTDNWKTVWKPLWSQTLASPQHVLEKEVPAMSNGSGPVCAGGAEEVAGGALVVVEGSELPPNGRHLLKSGKLLLKRFWFTMGSEPVNPAVAVRSTLRLTSRETANGWEESQEVPEVLASALKAAERAGALRLIAASNPLPRAEMPSWTEACEKISAVAEMLALRSGPLGTKVGVQPVNWLSDPKKSSLATESSGMLTVAPKEAVAWAVDWLREAPTSILMEGPTVKTIVSIPPGRGAVKMVKL